MNGQRKNLAALLMDEDSAETVTSPKPRLDPASVDRLSRELDYPSREPHAQPAEPEIPPKKKQRRHTTGRNVQVNVKATAETVELFYALSDKLGAPLGEVLALALQALDKSSE